MSHLHTIHSFFKDPLTEKLIDRYVESPKARKAIETSVSILEILMVAMPLIDSATKGVRDMMKANKHEQSTGGSGHSGHRRALPRTAHGVH